MFSLMVPFLSKAAVSSCFSTFLHQFKIPVLISKLRAICQLRILIEIIIESKALYDNLYPSRIIVGYPKLIDRPEFRDENEAILKVTDVEKLKEAAKTFAALFPGRSH